MAVWPLKVAVMSSPGLCDQASEMGPGKAFTSNPDRRRGAASGTIFGSAETCSPRSAMSHHDIRSAKRPEPDQAMVDIADYVVDYKSDSTEAYDTARYMLMDS